MIRPCFVLISMFAMTAGVTFAQAPTATTSGPAQVMDSSSDSGTQRLTEHDGVITDKPRTHTGETIVPVTDDKVTTQTPNAATTIR
jgi:hypothetical protein